MLLNTPENRLAITDYLENVGEDSFIEEFIIPFFSSNGYYLYRINSHGAGEHGKDIIFYKCELGVKPIHAFCVKLVFPQTPNQTQKDKKKAWTGNYN